MMTYRCPDCGREYKELPKFCGGCGYMFDGSEATDDASHSRPAREPFEELGGVKRMPDGIALGYDEIIVKRFRIGRYTLRKGEICVIVTNKRVIRYEESSWFGMKTDRIDEVDIDAVYGTSCMMRHSISILGLFATLIIFSLGINFFMAARYGHRFGYILGGIISIAAAVVFLVNSFRPTMCFHLNGAVGAPVLETNVNARGRLFGRNYSSAVFQFKPTDETTAMLKEIGACIHDVKILGDRATEKWK